MWVSPWFFDMLKLNVQSKEYKYNRQAFDLKARSMTEKYARAEASENESGNQNIKSHSNLSMVKLRYC